MGLNWDQFCITFFDTKDYFESILYSLGIKLEKCDTLGLTYSWGIYLEIYFIMIRDSVKLLLLNNLCKIIIPKEFKRSVTSLE